jgi:hypothetical protein
MRIPHSRVEIGIDGKGELTLETESRGKERKVSKIELSPDQVAKVTRQLEGLDWPKVSAEKTVGLDGSVVRVEFGRNDVSIWSPHFDTRKRGLADHHNLAVTLFDLAGLDPAGMPKSVR